MQVVDSTCGSDTQRLCTQSSEVSVMAVDKVKVGVLHPVQ